MAYLAFNDGMSLQLFCDAVAALARTSGRWELLARITRTPAVAESETRPTFDSCWVYEVSMHGPITRNSRTDMLFLARFPASDLVEVTGLVAQGYS